MICVIGAGVTGLFFAKAFGEAKVFEASDAPGGKACSQTVETDAGTFIFDTGGHWFHQQNAPGVLGLLDGLALIKHQRKAHVLMNSSLYDFPIQTSYVNIPDKPFVEAVKRELAAIEGRGNTSRTYRELLLNSYGETLYNSFFRDYNLKMFGVSDLSDIALGQYEAVRNVPVNNCKGYNNEFLYPDGNGGARAIPLHLSKGLDIRFNTAVQSISLQDNTLLAGHQTLKWSKIISTIPLPLLAKSISDLDPALLELSGQLKSCKGFILNVGIKKTERYQDIDWIYNADMDYHFYRMGYYSNVQPALAPAGYSAMYVECSPLFFSSREEAYALIPVILEELTELGFIGDKEDIITLNPVYLEHNYCMPNPLVTSALCGHLNKHGIYSIGRYGAWHWSSQHEDMQQALDLARQISGDGGH
ncbi:protoporphyrinogen/coproporphyrinogen oxidase [Paenibacillus sp. sgz500958]|uniref:protoporphyrinogen/coproporphyrinogen oxidase n=1 Tax=Paenibacillus sp. sgz500958 TaxID=3242475 RepID=UPI0036D37932